VQPAYSTAASAGPSKSAGYGRMQRLTKVGVLSFGKVMGATGLLMGLIVGIPYGAIAILIGLVGGASGEEGSGVMAAAGIGGGLLMMVLIPLLYGAFSFVFGLIYALIINLVLGFTGGLEIELR
jgi:hypothetical protein